MGLFGGWLGRRMGKRAKRAYWLGGIPIIVLILGAFDRDRWVLVSAVSAVVWGLMCTAIWPKWHDRDEEPAPKGDWCPTCRRAELIKDRCSKCGGALFDQAA